MAHVNNNAWVKTDDGKWTKPGKELPKEFAKELTQAGAAEEVVTESEKAEHKRMMAAAQEATKEYDDAFAKLQSKKGQVADLEGKRDRAQKPETKAEHQNDIDELKAEIARDEAVLAAQKTLLDRLAGTA